MTISGAQTPTRHTTPEILAPAGDTECFLAALAAGADGIYLGLKNFSARMQAQNFSLGEVARLTELAHSSHCRVYVAMNNLLKQSELEHAYRLARRLALQVNPDGLIIQDIAMLDIARQAGFKGIMVLSTLANATSPAGLATAHKLGAHRVVMPRELSIDEMKMMGQACPEGLDLECFVHGALCYCVSGRCYWSSYLGGCSGLRGRCVQPCRRVYSRAPAPQRNAKAKPGQRFFACQDLELAPVIKALSDVPNLASWKIEGRKKGPHYVYHAVSAYRILRDEHENPQSRKMALEILELALGRPGIRARFLPQRILQPMTPAGHTSSGRLAGKVSIAQNGEPVLKPHFELLPRDRLRIGVQDEKWHGIINLNYRVPKAGSLTLKIPRHKTPRAGTPVFLIDRREDELVKIIKTWQRKLEACGKTSINNVEELPELPVPFPITPRIPDIEVLPSIPHGKWKTRDELSAKGLIGLWLSSRLLSVSRAAWARIIVWLPPAIWPETEKTTASLIKKLSQNGCRQYVLNAPWQRSLFPEKLDKNDILIAGPFCNIANSLAIKELALLGFSAAFASPEISGKDMKELPKTSPLPLGALLGGAWPVGISRFGLAGITAGETFVSPHGESFWSKDRDGLTWLYPAWQLNISSKRKELEQSGYVFFAWLNERTPDRACHTKRPGLFNWDNSPL